ncbi:acyl-ACP--UDP-N-acetylglucosamine O-acyltransferase [Kibdelosporangium lantanae]
MALVHPTAVVSDSAVVADDVVIGPYAVVHPYVRLAQGVRVDAHAVIGGDPQDLSFAGGETWLEVGRDTVIREAVILHRSTSPDMPTTIGASCLIMGQVHISHDARVGDRVVVSQRTALAGHVTVDDDAVIGGMSAVHQHVRIGRRAMVGAMAKVTRDVLPFCAVDGNPATHRALNIVGLRRAGVSVADCRTLRRAYNQLRVGQHVAESTGLVAHLAEFASEPSRRGLSAFNRVREMA